MTVCRSAICCFLILVTATTAYAAAAPPKKANAKKFPAWTEAKATVVRQLQGRRGYRNGDILSQSDVERAMTALAKSGWKVADRKQIVAATLADNDFLVRHLRSRRGVPFMRKLGGNRQAYDRLDRLRRMPLGARRIPELINNPGGFTLIQYMVKTPGGRNLGRYLNQTRGTKNFNKATGRIYTQTQLLYRLKAAHAAEAKKRAAKPKAKSAV